MSSYQLKKKNNGKISEGPVVTVVLDGIGIGRGDASDGIAVSYTPVLDNLFLQPLMTTLKAHGTAVGLPSDDDMGNSEVGHNALGAGRIFSQGAKLVGIAIRTEAAFTGLTWKQIITRCAAGGTFHLIGLISDGNVHSHIDHVYALLNRAEKDGIRRVRIHGLLDGRDVAPKSALEYFEPLENRCEQWRERGWDYRIASGGGRMVTTMDRYQADWEVVKRGWQAHVLGEGRSFSSATEAIKTYYSENPSLTDQYMDSFVITDETGPVGTIHDGDAVLFFNFRGDRAIEISRAFEESDFSAFDRKKMPQVFFAGMMEYDGDAKIPSHFLVEPPAIEGTLGQYLCGSGVSSYAISETQKFGHVTYFWNGNNSGYIDAALECYDEVASDRVTFDQRPWMKAAEITDRAIAAIVSGRYRFIRMNYPNGDMVGHTGVEQAIRIAVETVDLCLGRLLTAVEKSHGIAVITADHGNADCMWTEKNGVRTPMVAHTKNPVPFVVIDYSGKNRYVLSDLPERGLANVAATICELLGFEPPEGYKPSLLRRTC